MATGSPQLKTLSAAVALILFLEVIGARIGISGQWYLAVIGALRLLEIACLVSVVFLLEKNVSCIGLSGSGILSAVQKGLLWSAGFALVAGAVALLLFILGFHPLRLIRIQLPPDNISRVLFFSVGGMIGPAAEEIFFRGLIYRFFRRWGVAFSLCFSTILFAAMHPMASGLPITQLVGGLLFAAAFEIEKNLLVPATIHILGNLAIFSLPLIIG